MSTSTIGVRKPGETYLGRPPPAGIRIGRNVIRCFRPAAPAVQARLEARWARDQEDEAARRRRGSWWPSDGDADDERERGSRGGSDEDDDDDESEESGFLVGRVAAGAGAGWDSDAADIILDYGPPAAIRGDLPPPPPTSTNQAPPAIILDYGPPAAVRGDQAPPTFTEEEVAAARAEKRRAPSTSPPSEHTTPPNPTPNTPAPNPTILATAADLTYLLSQLPPLPAMPVIQHPTNTHVLAPPRAMTPRSRPPLILEDPAITDRQYAYTTELYDDFLARNAEDQPGNFDEEQFAAGLNLNWGRQEGVMQGGGGYNPIISADRAGGFERNHWETGWASDDEERDKEGGNGEKGGEQGGPA